MTTRLAGRRNGLAALTESPKGLWLFLALYAVSLLLLLRKLPLWLDEIVDLKGIRDYDFAHLIAWVPANAGGVPLGYIMRFAVVHAFGYSTFSGRFPSLFFSLAACAGVFVLARLLKLRFPLLAVLIFSLVPLQLRYALESRPYSLALALSVWATAAFLRLLEQITLLGACVYGLLVLLGLYTQPFTLFVPVAHLLWLCFARGYRDQRRVLIASGIAVGLAVLGFLPWYLWTARVWSRSVATQHLHYTIQLRTVLVVLRELVGAGYLGTALILAAASLGLKAIAPRGALPNKQTRLFWSLYTLTPMLMAILADAAFGYFLAIRQMIFVLAPLSLLAALGVDHLAARRRQLAFGMASLLTTAFLFADARYFLRPHENWEAAAQVLQSLTKEGSCVIFVPADTEGLYEFFVPELARSVCRSNRPATRSVAVALSPYGSEQSSTWSAGGFRKTMEFNRNGPRVEFYER